MVSGRAAARGAVHTAAALQALMHQKTALSAHQHGKPSPRGAGALSAGLTGRLSGAARAPPKASLRTRSEQTQAQLAARVDRERARSCAASAQAVLPRRGA